MIEEGDFLKMTMIDDDGFGWMGRKNQKPRGDGAGRCVHNKHIGRRATDKIDDYGKIIEKKKARGSLLVRSSEDTAAADEITCSRFTERDTEERQQIYSHIKKKEEKLHGMGRHHININWLMTENCC
jgi:hypothetical protein